MSDESLKNLAFSWDFGLDLRRSGELRNRLYACRINDNINGKNIPALFLLHLPGHIHADQGLNTRKVLI
jgi:hypothetical protein